MYHVHHAISFHFLQIVHRYEAMPISGWLQRVLRVKHILVMEVSSLTKKRHKASPTAVRFLQVRLSSSIKGARSSSKTNCWTTWVLLSRLRLHVQRRCSARFKYKTILNLFPKTRTNITWFSRHSNVWLMRETYKDWSHTRECKTLSWYWSQLNGSLDRMYIIFILLHKNIYGIWIFYLKNKIIIHWLYMSLGQKQSF